MLKVLIIGTGAVGLGLASFLLQSGCRITLVGREPSINSLAAYGLDRVGIFDEFHAPPESFTVLSDLNAVPFEQFDFALVCVKSFDTEIVGRQITNSTFQKSSSVQLVLCQNGWGNTETFSQFVPQVKIFNAIIITGFACPERNKVDVTVHAQPLHLGSLYGVDLKVLMLLAKAFREGGIPSVVTTGISKDLWAKMLYNCALNALGALLEVSYGLLGENKNTRKIMELIVNEVFSVMHAKGYATHWNDPKSYLEDFYGKLLPSTYDHESSMLQDLRAGKMTEIDAINGVIVLEGEKRNILVPGNSMIRNLLQFLQGRPVK
tara:strand:- start:54 stop:1013 length:960 start_codon:yes stop_codon:yes gene_type:complete